MWRFVLVILMPLFLAGCFARQAPAPVLHFGLSQGGASSAGVHIVERGDTLYSISERYNLPIQEIAHLNNLYAPFYLEVGQRLDLPPPTEYTVQDGDNVYRIARIFDVSLSEITQRNSLRAPYRVYPGDVLRLPSSALEALPPTPGVKMASLSSSSASRTTRVKPKARSIPKRKLEKITARTPKRASTSGKFLKPVHGRVLSGFGPKKDGLHNDGINIAAPKGAPVRAAENGVVVYAGSELKGSGNLVLIRHRDRYMTAYAHMDKILIKRGQTIKRGATIGTVGSSGNVSKPQLHFEVRKGTRAINPTKYLEG